MIIDDHRPDSRRSYAGVTNVELAYRQLDVNQCPGERRRNYFANSAACDRHALVSSMTIE
jgi:hypothetical protein